MVYTDVSASALSADEWVARLATHGIHTSDFDERTLRFVTHLDVDNEGVERTLRACASVLG